MKKFLLALLLLPSICFAQGPAVSIAGPIGITGASSLRSMKTLAVSGPTYTMVPNEWWTGTLNVTGAPAAPVSIIAPANIGQDYVVFNKTTQPITIIAATGTGVTIPASASGGIEARFDGTNYLAVGPVGLGTMSTQNANAVNIMGGSISGTTITDSPSISTKNVANFPALGANLLGSAGWTLNGWTGTFGAGFTNPGGNTGVLTFPIATTAGQYYVVTYTMSGTIGQGVTTSLSGVSSVVTYNAAGTYSIGFLANTSSVGLTFSPSAFSGTLSAISLQLQAGTLTPTFYANDSTGSTSSEARVNLASKGNYWQGLGAGANASAAANHETGVGAGALNGDIGGQDTVAVGNGSMALSWGSINSAALGSGTFAGCKVCHNSVAIGAFAGSPYTSATNTVAIGFLAGTGSTSTNAVIIGTRAGSSTTSTSQVTLIGASPSGVRGPTSSLSLYTNIANTIECLQSNFDYQFFGGYCGIGKSPSVSLDVNGRVRSTGLADFAGPPTVTVNGTTGSTTYQYVVQATLADGSHNAPSATQTITNGNATLGGGNSNTISWTAIPGARQYNIYMLAPVAQQLSISYTTSITDSGAAYIGGTPAAGNNSVGLGIGSSQYLSSVLGTTGTQIPAALGSFINGNLRATDGNSNEVDAGSGLHPITVAVTTSSIAANTCADSTFTATGVTAIARLLQPVPPSNAMSASFSLNTYPSAAGGQVVFHWCNVTTSSATPTAGNYLFTAIY